LLGGARAREAFGCYRELETAVRLGDASGAEGWRTFLSVDLAEAGACLGLGLGLFYLLRPRRAVR